MLQVTTWPAGAPGIQFGSGHSYLETPWPVTLHVFLHVTPASPILQKRNSSVESSPEVVIFLNDWLMVLHTDLICKELVTLHLPVSPAPLPGPEGDQ